MKNLLTFLKGLAIWAVAFLSVLVLFIAGVELSAQSTGFGKVIGVGAMIIAIGIIVLACLYLFRFRNKIKTIKDRQFNISYNGNNKSAEWKGNTLFIDDKQV